MVYIDRRKGEIMKKILIGLGSVAAVTTPVVAVVACAKHNNNFHGINIPESVRLTHDGQYYSATVRINGMTDNTHLTRTLASKALDMIKKECSMRNLNHLLSYIDIEVTLPITNPSMVTAFGFSIITSHTQGHIIINNVNNFLGGSEEARENAIAALMKYDYNYTPETIY